MKNSLKFLELTILATAAGAALLFLWQKSIDIGGDNLIEEESENLNPELSEEVSLIAVGDIMTSRVAGQKMIAKGYDYPFLKVGDYLKTGDIVFGNLETPITPGRVVKTGEMMFRSDPEVAPALKNAGFSILSLANNHTPNFGENGLKDTFKYLTKAGLGYIGAGNNDVEAYAPVFVEVNGIKFAFLAYNSSDVAPLDYGAGADRVGTAFANFEKMAQAVVAASEKADFVIVSMHAGIEYAKKPNQFQINFAHAAIDAGTDLVIGHHPHVVQTEEVYKGRHIFYSLGNFIFDQMWSEETRKGMMVKFIFNKDGVISVERVPIFIEDYSQPRISTFTTIRFVNGN